MKNAKKTDSSALIQELSDKITTLTESMAVMAEQIKALQNNAAREEYEEDDPTEDEQPRENTLEEVVQECLNQFDFEKVAEIMKLLDWKWHGSDESPTPQEIRDLADSLFDSACEYLQNHDATEDGWNEAFSATGGIKAWVGEQKRMDDETEGVGFYAELQFIVEEWRAEPIK